MGQNLFYCIFILFSRKNPHAVVQGKYVIWYYVQGAVEYSPAAKNAVENGKAHKTAVGKYTYELKHTAHLFFIPAVQKLYKQHGKQMNKYRYDNDQQGI